MPKDNHSLRLSFAAGEDSLQVREFSIREALDELFQVRVVALSPKGDIDLDAIVGDRAYFYLTSDNPTAPERMWSGIVETMEQVYAGLPGAGSLEQSAYAISIVPVLWLTTQGRKHRVFQQKTVRQIVEAILAGWQIDATWKLDKGDEHYPKQDYVVQYGETDFDFICRLTEEAGISYLFRFDDRGAAETELLFTDQPHKLPERGGEPIPAYDEPPLNMPPEYLTGVQIAHNVAPGAVTVRDYEFRKQYTYPLVAEAPKAKSPEDFYEQYHYEHGAFLVDGKPEPTTPVADDRGMFPRHDEAEGKRLAERHLSSLRKRKRVVSFATNCPDLCPGRIFRMTGHPRAELGEPLMVSALYLDGTASGEWTFQGESTFAETPWVPTRRVPKPRIFGVQSAIVVGPGEEEIHTDEHGRVRAQLHWDRDGKYDDKASCWMRVSQDWAGAGFGIMQLPRVGQEVLVGYYGGDPDQPVIVGRVYNELTRVPYKLPDHKTRSTIKSSSSPGADGFNEIMFEDKDGEELVYQQAERDLQKLVKKYETERVGEDRLTIVGIDRQAVLGELEATMVGERYMVRLLKEPTIADLRIEEQKKPKIKQSKTTLDVIDQRIILTTGEACIVFDGKNIRFEANEDITIKAAGGDCIIEGKHVYLNTKTPPPAPRPDPFDPLEPGTFGYRPRDSKGKFLPQRAASLAKAPGQRPQQLQARKIVASDFYRKHGTKLDRASGQVRSLTRDERISELNGIDLAEPVLAGPFGDDDIPDELGQWQAAGGNRGNYFAPPGTTPSELGIGTDGKAWNLPGQPVRPKEEKHYVIEPGTPFLQSKAGPIDDDWSVPGVNQPATGGGTQYYVPDGVNPASGRIKEG